MLLIARANNSLLPNPRDPFIYERSIGTRESQLSTQLRTTTMVPESAGDRIL